MGDMNFSDTLDTYISLFLSVAMFTYVLLSSKSLTQFSNHIKSMENLFDMTCYLHNLTSTSLSSKFNYFAIALVLQSDDPFL